MDCLNCRLCLRRVQRFLLSASVALVVVGPATAAALIAIWTNAATKQLSIPAWVYAAGVIAVVLLILQAWAEYRKRTYDISWMFRYDDRWSSQDMKLNRVAAAEVLKKHHSGLELDGSEWTRTDNVLDFFDELGFNERGGQITPEVLHQNFHYWIRGYYLLARPYIEKSQQRLPSRWEHVRGLYEIVRAVAKERNRHDEHNTLDPEEAREFLSAELAAVTASVASPEK